jgi:hypothetical protein
MFEYMRVEKVYLAVVLFLLSFQSLWAEAGAAKGLDCGHTLARVNSPNSQSEEKTLPEIGIIHTPYSGGLRIIHTQLQSDGRFWYSAAGYSNYGSMPARERMGRYKSSWIPEKIWSPKEWMISFAKKYRAKPFRRYVFNATEAQKKALKEFLEAKDGTKAYQSCVGGACRALKAAGINIPFPFSQSPSLNRIYLEYFNWYHGLVKRVDLVGPVKKRHYLLGAAGELGLALSPAIVYDGVYWLTYWLTLLQ